LESVLSSLEFEEEEKGITEGGSDQAAKRESDIGTSIDPAWSHWVSIDGKTTM